MASVCSFSINMFGSTQELSSIQRSLNGGLHEPEIDPYKDSVLDLTSVYQDLDDTTEHTFVWVANEEVFVWSPGNDCLTLSGESRLMPPLSLVERLSRQHPSVRFELRGTVEEEEVIGWSVEAGVKTLKEQGFLVDHDPDDVRWLVKDGVKLPNYFEPWGGMQPPWIGPGLQYETSSSSPFDSDDSQSAVDAISS
jgi:hypothetical protein